MNTAFDILSWAQQLGVSITPAGDTLKLRAERKPPDDLLADMRTHKAEILAILSGEILTDEHEERAGQAEFDGGIPRAWAEGLAPLNPSQAPADVPPRRWLLFIDDCGRFADEWAWRASRLHWTPLALFGCDRTKPFARLDRAGLLWLVEGRRIVALTTETAAIEIPENGSPTGASRPSMWRR
jgi:hypothetical protein